MLNHPQLFSFKTRNAKILFFQMNKKRVLIMSYQQKKEKVHQQG